eukprot:scaffold4105_cov63-Phaeocystis_antarctica.AAC.5
MALAVKSSSSVKAGMVHIAGVRPGDAQPIIVELMAPFSVSVHVAGARAAGDGVGSGAQLQIASLALKRAEARAGAAIVVHLDQGRALTARLAVVPDPRRRSASRTRHHPCQRCHHRRNRISAEGSATAQELHSTLVASLAETEGEAVDGALVAVQAYVVARTPPLVDAREVAGLARSLSEDLVRCRDDTEGLAGGLEGTECLAHEHRVDIGPRPSDRCEPDGVASRLESDRDLLSASVIIPLRARRREEHRLDRPAVHVKVEVAVPPLECVAPAHRNVAARSSVAVHSFSPFDVLALLRLVTDDPRTGEARMAVVDFHPTIRIEGRVLGLVGGARLGHGLPRPGSGREWHRPAVTRAAHEPGREAVVVVVAAPARVTDVVGTSAAEGVRGTIACVRAGGRGGDTIVTGHVALPWR